MSINTQALRSVRALMRQMDLDSALKNSCANFHQKGFHYINLIRSPEYTAKLYFGIAGEVQSNEDGNLINPHSHGYAFRQTVLTGTLQNVILEEQAQNMVSMQEQAWREASYVSGFKTGSGVPALAWKEEPSYMIERVHTYYPGSGYFMETNEIHTIRVLPAPVPLILFSEQYRDEDLPETRYFDKKGRDPDMAGLYTPMTAEHAQALLSLVPNW